MTSVAGTTSAHQDRGYDGSLNGHTDLINNIDRVLQARYNIVSSGSAFLECDSLNDVVVSKLNSAYHIMYNVSQCIDVSDR